MSGFLDNTMTETIKIDFTHRQSAHCETGVIANLLNHHGVHISEALVFGIGSGIFFGYLPFIRLNHLPLTTFRIGTGGIMKRVAKRLSIGIKYERYRNQNAAMTALDNMMYAGVPVGCRTGAYWLTYFPKRYRFHFNMHNLVVVGKTGDDYIISDPVFPDMVVCPGKDLVKARFARGALAPKGTMYYLTGKPESHDFKYAVIKGMKEACNTMLQKAVPLFGAKGIRYLAGKVENWPKKLGKQRAALHIGQLIRMQEEIGTGGAGFRFMYAAFLQEAADILDNKHLLTLSELMTGIGDRWREVALIGSRICKNRAAEHENYAQIAAIMRICADEEEDLFRCLKQLLADKPVLLPMKHQAV